MRRQMSEATMRSNRAWAMAALAAAALGLGACNSSSGTLSSGQNGQTSGDNAQTGAPNNTQTGVLNNAQTGAPNNGQVNNTTVRPMDTDGHGEDEDTAESPAAGEFHGWWTVVVTSVHAPDGYVEENPEAPEAQPNELIGAPYVSFELTHAEGASEGAGSYTMGAASGFGGDGGNFGVVEYGGPGFTLRWNAGPGDLPIELVADERVDEDTLRGQVRATNRAEGLYYEIEVQRLED